jgi:hypothetical protein
MSVKDKTVLIFDYGMGVPFAERLGREFKKVGYYTPWLSSYPTANDLQVGAGFDNVERIKDFWKATDEYDLICFFDTHTEDYAEYLRNHGRLVFAPGRAEVLELDRWKGRKIQKAVGLSVQATEHIIGLPNLKKRLQQVKDRYVKLSLFRGEIETFCHKDYESSEPYLDKLAVSLGINKDTVEFIIEEKIKGGTEIGYDGFTVDGQYPSFCMMGWEVKDTSYVGKVLEYKNLFKPVKDVNDKLAVFFKKCQTRSMFSTEVKIVGGKGYLIDPTVRAPFPPSFVEMEMYENFGEFVYNAAQGKMIELKPVATYGVEAIMGSEFSEDNPLEVTFPKEMSKWVKLAGGCKIGGKYYILPGDSKNHYVSAVGTGKTVDEAVANVQKVIDKIEAFQLSKSFDKQSVLDKIAEGKKAGISF